VHLYPLGGVVVEPRFTSASDHCLHWPVLVFRIFLVYLDIFSKRSVESNGALWALRVILPDTLHVGCLYCDRELSQCQRQNEVGIFLASPIRNIAKRRKRTPPAVPLPSPPLLASPSPRPRVQSPLRTRAPGASVIRAESNCSLLEESSLPSMKGASPIFFVNSHTGCRG
jgi:hypothetical protein